MWQHRCNDKIHTRLTSCPVIFTGITFNLHLECLTERITSSWFINLSAGMFACLYALCIGRDIDTNAGSSVRQRTFYTTAKTTLAFLRKCFKHVEIMHGWIQVFSHPQRFFICQMGNIIITDGYTRRMGFGSKLSVLIRNNDHPLMAMKSCVSVCRSILWNKFKSYMQTVGYSHPLPTKTMAHWWR